MVKAALPQPGNERGRSVVHCIFGVETVQCLPNFQHGGSRGALKAEIEGFAFLSIQSFCNPNTDVILVPCHGVAS